MLSILNPKKLITKHLDPVFEDFKSFVIDLGRKIISLVKETLVTPLIGFINNRTHAYPLLTVILGKDPITGKKVERSPMAVLEGFLKLSKSGEIYLSKLKASGRLKKMLNWLDAQVAELNLNADTIRKIFEQIWASLDINSVLRPAETFAKIWKIISEPVGRLFRFVVTVTSKVFGFIKQWVMGKLKKAAKDTPGYPLLSVVLMRDPITQEAVPRTADNFIKGFMSLVPGGLEKYAGLKESGAIDKALDWLNKEVAKLGFGWKEIVGLFMQGWNSLTIEDLVQPAAAIMRIIKHRFSRWDNRHGNIRIWGDFT